MTAILRLVPNAKMVAHCHHMHFKDDFESVNSNTLPYLCRIVGGAFLLYIGYLPTSIPLTLIIPREMI